MKGSCIAMPTYRQSRRAKGRRSESQRRLLGRVHGHRGPRLGCGGRQERLLLGQVVLGDVPLHGAPRLAQRHRPVKRQQAVRGATAAAAAAFGLGRRCDGCRFRGFGRGLGGAGRHGRQRQRAAAAAAVGARWREWGCAGRGARRHQGAEVEQDWKCKLVGHLQKPKRGRPAHPSWFARQRVRNYSSVLARRPQAYTTRALLRTLTRCCLFQS